VQAKEDLRFWIYDFRFGLTGLMPIWFRIIVLNCLGRSFKTNQVCGLSVQILPSSGIKIIPPLAKRYSSPPWTFYQALKAGSKRWLSGYPSL